MRQKFIQKNSFIYHSVLNSQLQLVNFKRANYNLRKGEQRFNRMRNHKINFFESPNPCHFNFQNLTQCRYYRPQDPQNDQDMIFVTPIKMTSNFLVSPSPQIGHYLSCPQAKPNRTFQEDISEYYSQSHQKVEDQALNDQQIREKLVFSDEDEQEELLIPITPLKVQQKNQQYLEPTMRRQHKIHLSSTIQTPVSESRPVQRGLKKLAAEAYRFVVQQKRTSYKQVAKKLLQQLGDQRDTIVNNRGQMNIKRRVYDALNVLISLGLLKRIGHKLMIKRQQLQFTEQDVNQGRERQRRRELTMQQELKKLRQACLQRERLIIEKRKMQEQIKQKISSLKDLVDKNKSIMQQPRIHEIQQKNDVSRIQFPIFVLNHCRIQQQKFKEMKNEEMQQKQQQQLKLWQDNPEALICSFDNQKKIQLVGEMDLLALWKNEQKNTKVTTVYKKFRTR